MHVIHLSAECYPVAKVGGLGDVVGSLPKYLNLAGVKSSVVMPFYNKPFVANHSFSSVFEGTFHLNDNALSFGVLKEETASLGFDLYLIHVPGLLDRPEVYSYPDEHIQFIAFQSAFLEWILSVEEKPDILHCHDHHTGLIPFLITNTYPFKSLRSIPTVFTIHNAEYQGSFGWENASNLPAFDPSKSGLLDWDGLINPLAAAIKCCWTYTTVSPGYLNELLVNNNGLEALFRMEQQKSHGILNGIDIEIWDPSKDKMIDQPYSAQSVKKGKLFNKQTLCKEYGLNDEKPLISFIGRLVREKGADMLPAIISETIGTFANDVNFFILGSGEGYIETALSELKQRNPTQCAVYIGYNEELSHRVYASSDFLIMPSRVEPCGLNQLYSLRYGTMPIVNSVGGLKDTVPDVDHDDGYGIRFNTATVSEACNAIKRAIHLYHDRSALNRYRKQMMALDFSWQHSARLYINLYKTLKSLQ